ncbi:glycosyltransferase family 61 protein [Acidisphaera rubrifaciens]|uniref:Glycosyltransferase 61 catalytic domain-containing protein n=1 Tax=Acidisphaera rubrifaciens HS-AP3 TaxID=1231350 RepID=A0A0D6P916_9PROT|nr:glycosyltransferase 61 family protein [Acidisphaera rubrifaciens]GAN78147.1 hypothetical protein Asru_0653_04 [Acidisphaera rubrifaciens HS-AP3]
MPVHLTDIAAEASDIEAEAVNTATGTTLLGATFTDAGLRAAFSRRGHTTRLRQYTVTGAVFDTSLCTMHLHGRLIAETAYLAAGHEWTEPDARVDKVLNADAGHRPILGFNRGWADYHHWTMQVLPAIDHAIRTCRGMRPLCILPQIGRSQEATLRLLGHAHARYVSVAPHQRVQISACQISDLLTGGADAGVSFAVHDTCRRLAERANATADAGELLYVAQSDASPAPLVNEEALALRLGRMGFRVVTTAGLTPEEQIAIFRRARAVVGPPGTGMSNIGFCAQGTLVYELVPRAAPSNRLSLLAQAAGLIYAADLFDDHPAEDAAEDGWRADPALVEARLEELLDLVA